MLSAVKKILSTHRDFFLGAYDSFARARTYKELKQIDAALVVPGHGPASASWPKAIDPQIEYLKVIRRDIRKIIAEGGSINDAVGKAGQSQRNKWKLFGDVNGGNVTGAFAELEWE